MTQKLVGPFDDIYALARDGDDRPIDATAFSTALFEIHDAELLERVIARFLDDPVHASHFRTLLADSLANGEATDVRALTQELALRIARGEVRIRYLRDARNQDRLPGETVAGAPIVVTPPSPAPQPKPTYVRDWYFYCHHHVEPYDKRGQKNRNAYGRVTLDADGHPVTVIDVVPNYVGNVVPSKPGKDKLHFYWKDEQLGSPPKPELYLDTIGKPDEKIPPSGGEAGYTEYAFETPYLGGQDAILFIKPSFWREFMATTQYRLNNGPQALRVDVYHPRKYKFELKMPPLRGYKRGVKLGDGNADPRKLAKPEELKRKMEEEFTGWGPSKLPLVGDVPKEGKRESDKGLLNDPGGSFAVDDSEERHEYGSAGLAIKKAADKVPIKFYRDEVALDPAGLLTYIAAVLRLYRAVFGIIDTIKDYAPQAGFYVDFELQIMTGELAIEWQWKEYEDHRAYAAVDVNAKLTLFKVMLEMGVGVKACGGKLQVFAQVEGACELSMGYARTSPDGDAQLPFSFKNSIMGAIGARAEAGSFVKLEGKGQTGFELEFKVTIGIGAHEPGLRVEIAPTWTGISFTGTFSAAAFGISYEKTGKYDLVGSQRILPIVLPSETPYAPPHMSKQDIARVFRTTFVDGTDVLFYREGEHRDAHNHCPNPQCPGHGAATDYCRRWDSGDWNGWMDMEPVCDQLAEAVLADKGFTQTPKDIEALANSVREDFRSTSRMARTQLLGRNYVDYADAQRYIQGGTVRGCSLKAHLARGQQDPMLNQRVGP
ncbi:MAG: hypothetical protein AB7S26_16385 [Sandaracinaceae bacterium]